MLSQQLRGTFEGPLGPALRKGSFILVSGVGRTVRPWLGLLWGSGGSGDPGRQCLMIGVSRKSQGGKEFLA